MFNNNNNNNNNSGDVLKYICQSIILAVFKFPV